MVFGCIEIFLTNKNHTYLKYTIWCFGIILKIGKSQISYQQISMPLGGMAGQSSQRIRTREVMGVVLQLKQSQCFLSRGNYCWWRHKSRWRWANRTSSLGSSGQNPLPGWCFMLLDYLYLLLFNRMQGGKKDVYWVHFKLSYVESFPYMFILGFF